MANIFEATAPLRAHPWFGHAFGIAAVLLAFWLRSEVEDVLKGGLLRHLHSGYRAHHLRRRRRAGRAVGRRFHPARLVLLPPPGASFALEWPSGPMTIGFFSGVVALDIYLVHVMVRTAERLQAARAQADALAERQRTMFAELQHRVANNMQFVSSLLALQKRRVAADPASAPAALDEAAERLRTMARIHRRLYDPAAAKVGFGQHLREICADLLDAVGARDVACVVEAQPAADLPVETLIVLSLIATEAITNSLKHAWPEGGPGTIRIALERSEPGRVALSVSDDGRGLPADYDPAEGDSLGQRIIRSLVQQLGGELSVAAEGGTTTRVVFAA
ncbi:MAG: sensor histidine kinase [Acetobacteraceae bacterium]|nr:sensor histidine kinase [Acetobacteraceae bacterium]